jgi:AcrR family transcriptional regulator
MPKVVDHESRRREIARAVWRSGGRVGLDAVTVRQIADEAGYSTGVLAHYFADKDEMLLHALRVSVELAVERIKISGGATAHEALREGLAGCLPLDAPRRDEWRVWLAFWGRAAADERLAAEQRSWYERWRGLVRGLILSCQEEGTLPAELDTAREADLLVALVDGVGLQATLEPERLTAAKQTALLERQLALLALGGSPVE